MALLSVMFVGVLPMIKSKASYCACDIFLISYPVKNASVFFVHLQSI